MRDLLQLAQAGGAPTPGIVPPGPAPGTPVQPPQQAPAGPQGPPAQGAQQGLIPAPNSQGGLTPEQAQIVQIVTQDPIIMETLVNLLQQASQQGGQPGAPPGGPQQASQALFGG